MQVQTTELNLTQADELLGHHMDTHGREFIRKEDGTWIKRPALSDLFEIIAREPELVMA